MASLCVPQPWGIKELGRANYSSYLNIEGWHDNVCRDPQANRSEDPTGPKREDWGLAISLKYLNQYVDGV